MNRPKILILEDNPSAISALQKHLKRQWPQAVIENVISSEQVANEINQMPPHSWDLILLDYIAPDGYFHVLDINKFGIDKIIAISNTDAYNQLAADHGVTHIVRKTYSDLDAFAAQVVETAKQIIK